MKKIYTFGIIGLASLMLLGLVVASVIYFHSTQVDLTVSEARSSVDLPFSLVGDSGETVSHDLVIHNSANVPLCAKLTWQESTNPNLVDYTSNLPLTIALSPEADTTITTNFVFDEVTPDGTVTGLINYEKVECTP